MKRLTEQEEIKRLMDSAKAHNEANQVKDRLMRNGYAYAISLYGVLWNDETQKHEYRRIEVFLNGTPNQIDAGAIHEFFREIKPYQYYTIWAYNKERQEIILIKGWN